MSDIPKFKHNRVIFSKISGLEIKEINSDDFIVGGYIATSHLDSGFYDDIRNVWVKDIIPKETLELWRDEINGGNPRANKVSVHHEREPHVTGKGIEGSARVDVLPDGKYGLYVESILDKTKENYENVKYRTDKGFLDSFSIEFTTHDYSTGDYLSGAVKEEKVDNGIVRTLLRGSVLEGWTLASQPMNEYAVMTVKEVNRLNEEKKINLKVKEVENMTKEVKEKVQPIVEVKEEPVEEVTEKIISEPVVEEVKEKISDSDLKILKEAKEKLILENKEKEYKEISSKIKEELKESFKDMEVKNKVKVNPDKMETKEVIEYKEMFSKDSKVSVARQFQIAGRFAESKGMFKSLNWETSLATQREYKQFATNGKMLEMKGLSMTTNQNSDTDYLLSAAELSDVFDPVIYNSLNQETVTWNLLAKDDFSSKGNNQVQFTLKTAANTTALAYTGNSVTTGNVTRLKYQTKFKKYQVGVKVDGDMIAAARGGPIGDVFSQEVKDSTEDLLSVMNQALFAEVGLETVAGIIGFEYITDNSGNGTLYNLTRSTTNRLSPASNGDTYINGASADITVANLRAAKRQAIKEGAKLGNLVFVCDHVQGDKFRGIYDAIQRTMPTSSRFGFEGRPEFDGIPVFEDKDCNDDDWFLIDLETHRIAVWVPPTLEMLGKSGDSQDGFVKTYFATYNRDPRRMVQIHTNATS